MAAKCSPFFCCFKELLASTVLLRADSHSDVGAVANPEPWSALGSSLPARPQGFPAAEKEAEVEAEAEAEAELPRSPSGLGFKARPCSDRRRGGDFLRV